MGWTSPRRLRRGDRFVSTRWWYYETTTTPATATSTTTPLRASDTCSRMETTTAMRSADPLRVNIAMTRAGPCAVSAEPLGFDDAVEQLCVLGRERQF